MFRYGGSKYLINMMIIIFTTTFALFYISFTSLIYKYWFYNKFGLVKDVYYLGGEVKYKILRAQGIYFTRRWTTFQVMPPNINTLEKALTEYYKKTAKNKKYIREQIA